MVREWADTHELEITDENQALVTWYLRTARLLRTLGALGGGVLVPMLARLAFGGELRIVGVGADGMSPGEISYVFLGYLVGALYAEVALVRRVRSTKRSASLVPRELEDYLPRRVVNGQRVLGAAAALATLVLAAVPFPEGRSSPSTLGIVAFAGWIAAFAAGLELVERWVIRRPQPFTSPALLAADDAIRAQSVHALAGSGLAVLLLWCGGVSAALSASDVPLLQWTMWLPAAIGFLGSLFVCVHFGHRGWRVRRPVSGAEAVPV